MALFDEWKDANATEILGAREFLNTPINTEPVPRAEQMIAAVGVLARIGTLAAEAQGHYRVKVVNAWPEGPGSVELKKKQAEAESHSESVMADDLNRMCKALAIFIDICRTLQASSRQEYKASGLG